MKTKVLYYLLANLIGFIGFTYIHEDLMITLPIFTFTTTVYLFSLLWGYVDKYDGDLFIYTDPEGMKLVRCGFEEEITTVETKSDVVLKVVAK